MPNYYLFSPMLDEKGKQVVRHARIDEWVDLYNNPYPTSTISRPILTMKKFDHDPFEKLKKVYERYKKVGPGDADKVVCLIQIEELWRAISETVKELEGK